MADYAPLIPDEPCVEIDDLPERKRLIAQIGHAIAFTEPPLVVGVHGDWGAGKTSFLHYLQYSLTGECPQNPGGSILGQDYKGLPHILAVWFEAWRYQGEANPVIALLHEMRGQLTYKAHTLKRLLDDTQKYGSITVESVLMEFDNAISRLAAHLAGASASAVSEKTGLLSRIVSIGERRETDTLATSLPANKLRHYLKDIIGKLLPSKGDDNREPRLVIFIDDLDRCEADATLRLLEGIKVYLNLPNCVFVLGLNQREVERALARVMPSGKDDSIDSARLTMRAHEYLEKICANVWHLPLLATGGQEKLLRHWFGPPSVGAEPRLPEEEVEALIALLKAHDFLPANARRLKAFANSFLRLRHRRAVELAETHDLFPVEDIPLVAILASLQQFHPRLWRLIESESDFYFELAGYARNSHEKKHPQDKEPRDHNHLHEELLALEMPHYVVRRKDDKTLVESRPSRFADRAYGNVLHCQSLLEHIDITRPQLRAYLNR